ncbi:hypothetical protein [Halosimplex salinum]|uniref:hypothetical protein n=1 Tax=Halosimplex salinum TaxID=1710538 RepID=UPI0013DDADD7|nr:hypothetical protein [Halosimplex salinum]
MSLLELDFLNEFREKSRIWWLKWLFAAIFVFSTSFSFFGFFDLAPTFIFAGETTEIHTNLTSGSIESGEFVVEVTEQSTLQSGDAGIEIGGIGFSIRETAVLSLIQTLVALLGFSFCSYLLRDRGSTVQIRLLNSAVSSVGSYVFIFWLLKSQNVLIRGETGVENGVFWFGLLIHYVSIASLLYVYSGELVISLYSLDSEAVGIYLQHQGRIAQGVLSIGLAVGIGGALSFASSSTSNIVSIASLVGVFLIPLAGIATHQYYRMCQVEIQNRCPYR